MPGKMGGLVRYIKSRRGEPDKTGEATDLPFRNKQTPGEERAEGAEMATEPHACSVCGQMCPGKSVEQAESEEEGEEME